MHKLYFIPFLVVLILSINSIAFEDSKIKKNINLIYKLNASFDDLVLNYCSTYDSYTINRLYSEKKIRSLNSNNNKQINKFLVQIKIKPLNPNIASKIEKETKLVNFFDKKDYIFDTNFLSGKKRQFIETLLPIIAYENQKIIFERENLYNIKTILNDKQTLNNQNILFLNKIAKNYKIKTNNKHKLDLIDELLVLVDVIPNSIVLAQAANESGWGSSRFAKEYNALFGEYTYDFSNGVVPLKRESGEKHLVKSFSSVNKSVQSYFKNLNTHYAYKDFRLVREVMRNNNNFSNINLLVDRLDTYALDIKYIETIKAIIKTNNLQKFDSVNYTFIKS